MTNSLLTINYVYYLIGFVVLILAAETLCDKKNPKRYTTALFWFVFGIIFIFGDLMIVFFGKALTYRSIGLMVIFMSVLAGSGQLASGKHLFSTQDDDRLSAHKFGNLIFLPAIAIPVVTVLCVIFLKDITVSGRPLLDQVYLTLVSLSVACISALLIGWFITGETPMRAVKESHRLLDSIGWLAILPQMLAMLGGVFVVAETGNSVQTFVSLFIKDQNPFLIIVIYCVGMALLTMIMGNAFAAFPIMTAGIALPFLIIGHNVNPAPIVAIGMYSGYCGTLMTPMAANFNIVPAALLSLRDQYQVIKVQFPTALAVLLANIFLLYFISFPKLN